MDMEIRRAALLTQTASIVVFQILLIGRQVRIVAMVLAVEKDPTKNIIPRMAFRT